MTNKTLETLFLCSSGKIQKREKCSSLHRTATQHVCVGVLGPLGVARIEIQEIWGHFYGARATGVRPRCRNPEQPFTGTFTGPKRVPVPG